ncbi:putative secreted protein (Por secretion system target) [Dokdonia sp. Hel_I_63]|uniref:DUF5689 domain-containing protein n=1 Tax=Dokdonia sp. Hel_I_63 TaxID=1249996 RepID=UPI00119A82FC|nr:DUF5689 domain-containing protein [Dokdonia sp. Hel_I_63]TVZ23017.1 putative secreted protein (Por secretion system target) [Dokdonia sp. Hel_I_63]
MKKKLLSALLCIILAFLTANLNAQGIFINELHYDNAGGDVNEGIELAGPAGTDLAGWSLVLYNGSNNEPYRTVDLTGVIANQQNGYGTVNYPITGIQNGAPDGIALVDGTGNLVQFISYEGELTAIGGPADGLTSRNISVSEGADTSTESSLSLSGNGIEAADFTWEITNTNTFGAVNTNQVFGTLIITPVINEFVFNHTGSDTDEFIEVLAGDNEDLSAYSLLIIEGDVNSVGTITSVFQLGTTTSDGLYTIPFQNNVFQNGSQTILLVTNFIGNLGETIDTDLDGLIDVNPWDEIIDSVAVSDGDEGDMSYSDVVLTNDFDGGIFTVGGASRIPSGTNTGSTTDWIRNNFNGAGLPSFPSAIPSAGEAINSPNSANSIVTSEPTNDTVLLINEIDADNTGTDTMEFVELYDGGTGNTLLDGYTVVFYNGSSDTSYASYSLDGFTTNANGFFVLGNESIATASIVFASNGIQNGADAVALYKDATNDFANGSIVDLDNLLDAVVYDTNDADDDGLLILLKEGQEQLNEDELSNKDTFSLQRFTNGSGGLRETATYVNALPTPGATNNNATEPITLVINELDADTAGSDSQEFLEIFDGGQGNTSLSGFVVVAYNGNGDAVYNTFDLEGFTTNEEGYFVLGNADVLNVDLVIPSNSFQNGADAIGLYQGTAVDFPNGSVVTLDRLVDAIVYGTDDDTDLELIVLLNSGQQQLNENSNGSKDSESLQRIPNGQGGTRNTANYIAQTPTPGGANDAVVTAGEVLTIAQVRSAAEGDTVTTTGILTVSDQFNGPAFIQDETGGIAIFDNLVHGENVFAIGDSITVTGTRSSFNGLAQISPVNIVEINAPSTSIIEPITITLSQLSDYEGQLVRVIDASFPNEGDLLFGNSNFELTDSSGSGQLRIDGNASSLITLTQPSSCDIVGVVGRFGDNFQLLPRLASDIPCATPFESPDETSDVSRDDSFDVVAWNIEWFGDENNAPPAGRPMSDEIQRDSVRTVLRRLDADVIAVEEIADDILFAELVDGLEGYDYILSDAVSNPTGTPPFQKLGFIYKTATVNLVKTQALLATIHPLYNGGDDSALVDYPSTTDRFYASGRLPFLMTADVTINGTTEQIDLIALHARANGSTQSQNRYDMRRYDVEVLKDSLDVQFSDRKIILLGDYNDDVDETVADEVPTTESSFIAYVQDPENYNVVTSVLSDAGFRSFVSRENMIDHIAITDELFDNYIESSASVGYQFYDEDYAFTASDHFPVSARFIFDTIEPLEVATIEAFDITCFGVNDGVATVSVTGGVAPYSYVWSDGQTENFAENLTEGTYSVIITDSNDDELLVENINISSPAQITFSVSNDVTIYKGYGSDCTTLSVSDIVAEGDTSILWSTGETTESITFCPEATSTVSVTVMDDNGCETEKEITVTVEDVTCDNNPYFQRVQLCYKGRSLCVSRYAARVFLRKGATLGACDNSSIVISKIKVYPNPVIKDANVKITSSINTEVSFELYNIFGVRVFSQNATISDGQSITSLQLGNLHRGFYFLKPTVNGVVQGTKVLIKR